MNENGNEPHVVLPHESFFKGHYFWVTSYKRATSKVPVETQVQDKSYR